MGHGYSQVISYQLPIEAEVEVEVEVQVKVEVQAFLSFPHSLIPSPAHQLISSSAHQFKLLLPTFG
jgi:hypothetical protein